jgi:hypothetical protein
VNCCRAVFPSDRMASAKAMAFVSFVESSFKTSNGHLGQE